MREVSKAVAWEQRKAHHLPPVFPSPAPVHEGEKGLDPAGGELLVNQLFVPRACSDSVPGGIPIVSMHGFAPSVTRHGFAVSLTGSSCLPCDRAVDLIYRGIRPIARRPTHIPQLGTFPFRHNSQTAQSIGAFLDRPQATYFPPVSVVSRCEDDQGFSFSSHRFSNDRSNGNHRHAPFRHRHQSNLFRCSRLHAVNLDPVALKTTVSHS